jgi:hypothetical protein
MFLGSKVRPVRGSDNLTAIYEPHFTPQKHYYYFVSSTHFWGVKCGRCVDLTTLPPSMSQLSRQYGILNMSQPYRPSQPVTGIALLFSFYIYVPEISQVLIKHVFCRALLVTCFHTSFLLGLFFNPEHGINKFL